MERRVARGLSETRENQPTSNGNMSLNAAPAYSDIPVCLVGELGFSSASILLLYIKMRQAILRVTGACVAM